MLDAVRQPQAFNGSSLHTHGGAGSTIEPSTRGDVIDLTLAHDTTELLSVGDNIVIDVTSEPARIIFGDRVLPLVEQPPPTSQRLLVRMFDLVISTMLLVLLMPVFVALWIAVRVTSPGRAVYASPRIGADGNPFPAYKFRSMVMNADELLHSHLDSCPEAKAEYERFHKLRDDPRITPIGSFIRKTSLDELPQLVNVFRGDMSLVGPRPKLLTEPARFGAAMSTVLRVKPGITGLWQVSGRSDLSFDERIILDVEYATRRTLRGDIMICLKTAWQALRPGKHGAY